MNANQENPENVGLCETIRLCQERVERKESNDRNLATILKAEGQDEHAPLEGRPKVEKQLKRDLKNYHLTKFTGNDEGNAAETWL